MPAAPLVLFPSSPLSPNAPDGSFEDEARQAARVGLSVGLVDCDTDADPRLRRIPEGTDEVLYRGWIVDLDRYRRISDVLAARGCRLVTSPAAYEHCHHLPQWYAALGGAEHTARSIWIPGAAFDVDVVATTVRETFGARAVVLKDYVKSRKHEWFDACFIPDASDDANVRRVVGNFLRLQEGNLVGGLVFREFVPLRPVGFHSKSKLPLVNEHRFFVLDGRPFYTAPYWAEGDYSGAQPEAQILEPVLSRVASPFYTIDVAERESGGWLVVELNDGGCAGIPEGGTAEAFYDSLGEALRSR